MENKVDVRVADTTARSRHTGGSPGNRIRCTDQCTNVLLKNSIDQLEDSMICLREDGDIIFANRAAEDDFGTGLRGKNFLTLPEINGDPTCVNLLKTSIETRQCTTASIRLGEGTKEVKVDPVADPGNDSAFNLFVVFRDTVDAGDGDLRDDAGTTRSLSRIMPEPEKQINVPQKVLVVDDEPIIRQMLGDCFDILGYSGYFGENGHDALDLYDAHKDEIGLVILDMIMPGIDGDQVLHELKQRDPDLNVVISSAYSVVNGKKSIRDLPADGWLDKPFKIADLQHMLESFLPV